MYVSHRKETEKRRIKNPAVYNVEKQVLIGPEQGWDDYVMRMFTLGPEGYTPRHSHSWPHILYILEGRGTLFMGDDEHALTPGSTAYVTGGVEHQLLNTGKDDFVFICIVPKEGDV